MILLAAQRGQSALHVALECGHVGLVALLLDFMCSVDNKVRNNRNINLTNKSLFVSLYLPAPRPLSGLQNYSGAYIKRS